MNKLVENLKKCSRFETCSINVCPLDLEAELRNKLLGEEECPYTIKRKKKEQKGIILRVSDGILLGVPKSNLKLLNNRNLKRWHELHK
jgi:hypothetical protein